MKKFILAAYGLFFFFTGIHQLNAAPVTAFGDIYRKSSWTGTSDFITNGNTSATLSGNYINISSSTTLDYNNTVYITNYQTKLEKWTIKARFKIISWASNSYGIGFGLRSSNPVVKNDVMGFIQTASTGTGGLYIIKSDQSILSTGSSPLGVALNDVIDIEAIFYDSVFTFKTTNLTSGNTAMVSYTYASNGSTHAVPNTGYFSLLELGGTHQLQQLEITSTELTNANIVAIGDSKTIGYYSSTFAGRYAAKLNNNYPNVVINAGGGDRVTQVLNRIPELQRLAPSKFLLSIGSNDLRFGGSLNQLKTDYTLLVNTLLATGAQVYHMVLPEDYTKSLAVQGTALIDFKNWVATTFAAYYINAWDSLSVSDYLEGIYDTNDGVHLNQLANNKIYEAIVASNKLNSGSLPISLLNFSATKKNNQAILHWQTALSSTAENFVVEKSTDRNRFFELKKIEAVRSAVYNYTDETLVPGNNYYRLKMMDINGSTSYSPVAVVNNKTTVPLVNGFKKLNEQLLQLSVTVAVYTNITWQVTGMEGKTLRAAHQKLIPGNNQLLIDTGRFPTGWYCITVYSNEKEPLFTLPFIK